MTENKQLSPAAQAVLDAAMNTPIVLGDYDATRSHQIASSLREIVYQLKCFGITEKNILSIANELEGK